MSTKNPFRFGLVGAGAIAQAYAQALAKSERVELAAITDCRFDAAEKLAATAGCPAFPDAATMADAVELDAAIVCTPPATHRDVCCQLLEDGLHVLCEKPLAIDSASAREMIDAADARGLVFTMASKFRYVADVTHAKSLIAEGLIGEVVLFENVFTGRVDMTHRWNSDPKVAGGGVLIDNGTHSVDITRYFLGALAEVQAMEGHRIQDLPVEDTAKMFVRSGAGVLASIDLSWSVSKEIPYFIAVYGSQGAAGRLAGVEVPPHGRSGLDRVWRRLRQSRGVPAATRELCRSSAGRRGPCRDASRRARVGAGDRGGVSLAGSRQLGADPRIGPNRGGGLSEGKP